MASIAYRIKKFWKKITGQGDVTAITKSLNKMVDRLEKHHSFAVAEAAAKQAAAAAILAAAEAAEKESARAINAARKISALFDDEPKPAEAPAE